MHGHTVTLGGGYQTMSRTCFSNIALDEKQLKSQFLPPTVHTAEYFINEQKDIDKTFDLNSDSSFGFHEVVAAVKTRITFAEKMKDVLDTKKGLYVLRKKIEVVQKLETAYSFNNEVLRQFLTQFNENDTRDSFYGLYGDSYVDSITYCIQFIAFVETDLKGKSHDHVDAAGVEVKASALGTLNAGTKDTVKDGHHKFSADNQCGYFLYTESLPNSVNFMPDMSSFASLVQSLREMLTTVLNDTNRNDMQPIAFTSKPYRMVPINSRESRFSSVRLQITNFDTNMAFLKYSVDILDNFLRSVNKRVTVMRRYQDTALTDTYIIEGMQQGNSITNNQLIQSIVQDLNRLRLIQQAVSELRDIILTRPSLLLGMLNEEKQQILNSQLYRNNPGLKVFFENKDLTTAVSDFVALQAQILSAIIHEFPYHLFYTKLYTVFNANKAFSLPIIQHGVKYLYFLIEQSTRVALNTIANAALNEEEELVEDLQSENFIPMQPLTVSDQRPVLLNPVMQSSPAVNDYDEEEKSNSADNDQQQQSAKLQATFLPIQTQTILQRLATVYDNPVTKKTPLVQEINKVVSQPQASYAFNLNKRSSRQHCCFFHKTSTHNIERNMTAKSYVAVSDLNASKKEEVELSLTGSNKQTRDLLKKHPSSFRITIFEVPGDNYPTPKSSLDKEFAEGKAIIAKLK